MTLIASKTYEIDSQSRHANWIIFSTIASVAIFLLYFQASFLILSILLFVLKFVFALQHIRIELDQNRHVMTWRKVFRSTIISSSQINNWDIVINPLPGRINSRDQNQTQSFLKLYLSDHKTMSYPLIGPYSLKEIREDLTSFFGKPSNSKIALSTQQAHLTEKIKYTLWFLFLV